MHKSKENSPEKSPEKIQEKNQENANYNSLDSIDIDITDKDLSDDFHSLDRRKGKEQDNENTEKNLLDNFEEVDDTEIFFPPPKNCGIALSSMDCDDVSSKVFSAPEKKAKNNMFKVINPIIENKENSGKKNYRKKKESKGEFSDNSEKSHKRRGSERNYHRKNEKEKENFNFYIENKRGRKDSAKGGKSRNYSKKNEEKKEERKEEKKGKNTKNTKNTKNFLEKDEEFTLINKKRNRGRTAKTDMKMNAEEKKKLKEEELKVKTTKKERGNQNLLQFLKEKSKQKKEKEEQQREQRYQRRQRNQNK